MSQQMSRLDPLFAPRVALAPLSAAHAAGLARLGALLTANPAIEEIEINPLRITREGLVALDAVLRTSDDCA